MNLFEMLTETPERHAIASRIYGVVLGIVTNNQDPEKLGRVKVKFPWLSDDNESNWARVATPMAGKEQGIYFLPEVESEVLVIFEQGDVRFPYIIGTVWNGEEKPPLDNEEGQNNIRMIRSRSGHTIQLNDEEGKETIEISDKDQTNLIVFDTANQEISITSQGDIVLTASQGSIKLDAQKIEMKTSSDTQLESDAGINIKAQSTMNLKGATINLN